MPNHDARNKSRRQTERRNNERRLLSHNFMSPEWLDRIQKEHLLWPKRDRRVNNRRLDLRRAKSSRRLQNIPHKRIPEIINDQSELLTPGERKMLFDLMNQNISD